MICSRCCRALFGEVKRAPLASCLGQPKGCSEPAQSKGQLKERNQANGLVSLKCALLPSKASNR